jgi:hypothetical protein
MKLSALSILLCCLSSWIKLLPRLCPAHKNSASRRHPLRSPRKYGAYSNFFVSSVHYQTTLLLASLSMKRRFLCTWQILLCAPCFTQQNRTGLQEHPKAQASLRYFTRATNCFLSSSNPATHGFSSIPMEPPPTTAPPSLASTRAWRLCYQTQRSQGPRFSSGLIKCFASLMAGYDVLVIFFLFFDIVIFDNVFLSRAISIFFPDRPSHFFPPSLSSLPFHLHSLSAGERARQVTSHDQFRSLLFSLLRESDFMVWPFECVGTLLSCLPASPTEGVTHALVSSVLSILALPRASFGAATDDQRLFLAPHVRVRFFIIFLLFFFSSLCLLSSFPI